LELCYQIQQSGMLSSSFPAAKMPE
jgi:hypothetical protein